MALQGKKILLIITGGIAAYKVPALIRLLRKEGAFVRCVLSKGGAQFVTPLTLAALSEDQVYDDLWSLKDETEMGHIRLSREADLVLVVPASANMIGKMAHGLADDLASTVMLANDKPVMIAPAMNVRMWEHAAVHDNMVTLRARGVNVIDPVEGEMACGEYGFGRMVEPEAILAEVQAHFGSKPLAGKRALVTAGPTYEAIDPVRFIGNHSSGRQGYAVADALVRQGAEVVLVSGPSALEAPAGVRRIDVTSAEEMRRACMGALPVDMAVCAAAVADWTVAQPLDKKIKKADLEGELPAIELSETVDIVSELCASDKRPGYIVAFAAETNDLENNAKAKLVRKNCDAIVANDVSNGAVFGAQDNMALYITKDSETPFERADKSIIAQQIVLKIIEAVA